MAKENVLHFRLDGVDYDLRGDKSPEQMEEIVQMVSNKIEQIRGQSPHYSSVRATTLAALQLAADLQESRLEAQQLLNEVAVSRSLIRRRPRPAIPQQNAPMPESAEAPVDTMFMPK